MIDFKSVFDFTKLPTKIFIVLAFASGIYLFSPETIIKTMHFDKFENYGGYIGLIFVFSISLVVINFFLWIYNTIQDKLKLKQLKKEYREALEYLDPKEKAVLREFAIQGQNSIEMPYDDTIVSGLIDKRILRFNRQLGSSFFANGTKASITLNKYVSEILTPEHIGLSITLTEEEKETIEANRPEWVKNRWY